MLLQYNPKEKPGQCFMSTDSFFNHNTTNLYSYGFKLIGLCAGAFPYKWNLQSMENLTWKLLLGDHWFYVVFQCVFFLYSLFFLIMVSSLGPPPPQPTWGANEGSGGKGYLSFSSLVIYFRKQCSLLN